MCKKLKYTEEEAWNKVNSDRIEYLNYSKRRVQVHAYHCRSCKAWHTTTIPYSHLKIN